MLRQLARLTRPLPAAGPDALAVAVYADTDGRTLTAQEAGFEGVACVDDASRLLVLLCDLWEVTRLDSLRRWAGGILDFVLWMQEEDGRWLNFVGDWEGARNREGRTSLPGGGFWQARAVHALAKAAAILHDERALRSLDLGLQRIDEPAPADVRVLHMLTAMELLRAGSAKGMGDRLEAWSEEVARCRRGDVLMNSSQETGTPHLWGHLQEGVLADAGAMLGRDDLILIARRSAELVFTRVLESGFDAPRVQPYDVSSAVYVMDRLFAVTGEAVYTLRAEKARAWYDGRNSAGRPIYDRQEGRIADGIDERRVSTNSGAEANIVGAQSLFADAMRSARMLTAEGDGSPFR